MVKKVILTTLFLLLTTGIFGMLNTKAHAQSCQTTQGWPGKCKPRIGCLGSVTANVVWDPYVPICNGLGCCGITTACHTDPSCTPPTPVRCLPKILLLCCSTEQDCFDKTGQNQTTASKVCDFVSDKNKQLECNNCMNNGSGAWTALGCIPTDPSQFIGKILGIGVGIGGGIAFLLILFGGFQILMSAGNPEKLTAGKELVTSAITGLLIIIFSLFILRLIGFNIFGIPGFG